MEIEKTILAAILAELERQGVYLQYDDDDEMRDVIVDGHVDMNKLASAVRASIASNLAA